ncbi:MAG: neutral zinc metallopeptidase [Comamonadaceae bacterium]|nr:neutral zinc metallopeptidase [Comamonadaceae bacterium]
MGPFYCPADRKVYIDLAFYDDLRQRFRAPGDFAQAYVIAHEVGHHVQNLLGIIGPGPCRRSSASARREANQLSVRLELQADCLAGVWAHHADRARQIAGAGRHRGGAERRLRPSATTACRSSRRATSSPDSFTHGTSAQRVQWFKRGLQATSVKDCDTFGG